MTTKAELTDIIQFIATNHPSSNYIVGKLEQLVTDDGFEYELPPYQRGDKCWRSPTTNLIHHQDCELTDKYGAMTITTPEGDLVL